jgi:hypothetical protein
MNEGRGFSGLLKGLIQMVFEAKYEDNTPRT